MHLRCLRFSDFVYALIHDKFLVAWPCVLSVSLRLERRSSRRRETSSRSSGREEEERVQREKKCERNRTYVIARFEFEGNHWMDA